MRYFLVLQDHTNFMTSQTLITKRLRYDGNGLYVYQCFVFKILTVPKIRTQSTFKDIA